MMKKSINPQEITMIQTMKSQNARKIIIMDYYYFLDNFWIKIIIMDYYYLLSLFLIMKNNNNNNKQKKANPKIVGNLIHFSASESDRTNREKIIKDIRTE